jgi:ATP-binding cassette subfamily B protein
MGGDAMAVDEAPQKIGVREFLSLLRAASALAWRSSAGWLLAQVLLAAVGGTAPVATAWLTKVVLDRLTRPDAPLVSLLAPAAALACTGVATAVVPQIG